MTPNIIVAPLQLVLPAHTHTRDTLSEYYRRSYARIQVASRCCAGGAI